MDAVIETTVRKLGYRDAKDLQTKSINEFVSGNDVFRYYQYVLDPVRGTRLYG